MQNLTNTIKNAFSIFKAAESGSGDRTPTGYETQGYGRSGTSISKKGEYLNEMKGWVGGCVSVIADEVATIQLRLYKHTTKGGTEEVLSHPILDDLYRVNDYTTKFDHFWLTTAYLKTTGEAPWLIERKPGGVKAIYFLRPDRITPIVGDDKLIIGYEYLIGDHEKVQLPFESVIFLKIPDPANPFRGLGNVQMAARTIDIDNYSEEWNKTFYENSAHPDSVLSVNVDQLQTDQLDRLKKSIKESYEGLKKAHKTMVLFGDMKWEKIGFSQKDMDFLEQQRFSRDKIMGLFRVPKAILAQTEGTNFASAKVAQYVFARWTIRPEMERLVQQLNEFLLPMYSGTEQMFLSYDNPVPQDDETESKIQERLVKSGIMAINEARRARGLADVEGGDSIYLPMNLVPMGESQATEKTIIKELKVEKQKQKGIDPEKIVGFTDRIRAMRARNKMYFEIEDIKDEIYTKVKASFKSEIKNPSETKDLPEAEEDSSRKTLTSEQKDFFWRKKDALTDKYFPKFKKLMADLFRIQSKKVLTGLGGFKTFKLDSNTVFNKIKLNEKKEISATLVLMLPEIEKLFEEAGDAAYELLGLDISMDASEGEIQKLLKADTRKFAKEVTKFTNIQLKKTITTGIAKGESVDELKESVRKLFHKAEEYRADRIARSETVRYNTSASEQAFVDSEIVEKKEWFAHPGACEFCRALNGKTVSLKKTFVKKGNTVTGVEGGKITADYTQIEHPPLHVMCRCEIVPVFKSAKSTKPLPVKKKILKKIKNDPEKDKKEKILENKLKEVGEIKEQAKKELENVQKTVKNLKNIKKQVLEDYNKQIDGE